MLEKDRYFEIIDETVKSSLDVLTKKRKEYATEDLLHNFNTAAELKGETPRAALAGMMVKHTISLYDMCMSDITYPLELWDEKIGDHINYLLLLRAVIEEEYEEPVVCDNVG